MNNEGSTILVTGAAGTVGSEVVRQLSAKGQIGIRAAARSANNPTFKDLKSVEIVELDYNNKISEVCCANFRSSSSQCNSPDQNSSIECV
ncbi:MAG: NAD-dependent epimerase/dehydratase family protein [Thermoproteota archaeon]|nr:NAD-dependent epimerase/dehydratase family protein [Thermoproteota archaeon]